MDRVLGYELSDVGSNPARYAKKYLTKRVLELYYLMKSIIFLISVFIFGVFLTSCEKAEIQAEKQKTYQEQVKSSDFEVWNIPNNIGTFTLVKDKRTGQEYLFRQNGGAVKIEK